MSYYSKILLSTHFYEYSELLYYIKLFSAKFLLDS